MVIVRTPLLPTHAQRIPKRGTTTDASATSRVESFIDDAHDQLELLHREVFDLTHASRAHSAAPLKSVVRARLHHRTVSDYEGGTHLARYDIAMTQRHVTALSLRPPDLQRSDLIVHRLRDADALGQYARRQGLEIVAELDGDIDTILALIEERQPEVENDDRMPSSPAARRRLQLTAFLDDRLDMSRRWNNALQTGNRTLREQIDDLNLERATDLGMLNRMREQICARRETIRSILLGMAEAEQQQEALISTLHPLGIQTRAENEKFVDDWAHTAELDERHREIEEEIIRKKGEMYFGTRAELTPDESIRKIMSRTAWRIARDKALLVAASDRHKQIKNVLDALQEISGCENIDDIATQFELAQVKQLVNFNEIQRIVKESGELRRSLASVCHAADHLRFTVGDNSDKKRSTVTRMASVVSRNETVMTQTRHHEEELDRLKHVFSDMTAPIQALFTTIRGGHRHDLVEDMLIHNGVSSQNIDTVVSALEQESWEMLATCSEGRIRQGPLVKTKAVGDWREPGVVDEDGVAIVPPSCPENCDTDVR